MTAKGRRRYEPDRRKFVEVLGGDQYQLLRDVLARPEVASDLPGAWLHVQRERLALAEQHLDVAEQLNELGVSGEIRPEKRSVISRAYYAMFCASPRCPELSITSTVIEMATQRCPKGLARLPSEPRPSGIVS